MPALLASVAPPVLERDTDRKTRHAPLYKALLHNDDVTPFDFVVQDICQGVFKLAAGEAFRLTLAVHRTGLGVAGIYPLEQAELRRDQAHDLARARGYPLLVTIEPA